MEALNIEQVDKAICDACPLRFLCYTNRNYYCLLTADDEWLKLANEAIKKMHIAKAKKQGHYFTPEERD